MKIHLDYDRLIDRTTDPVLAEFLIKVYEQDSMRRAMTAFPEFFTTEKTFFSVHRSTLAKRYFALKGAVDDAFEETLSWFGASVVVFENNTDRAPDKKYPVAPKDFKLERTSRYNGFKNDPWIVDLDANDGKGKRPFLILKVLRIKEKGCQTFFLWAVENSRIDYNEPTED